MFLAHIFISVTALDVTYPKIGTIYSPEGPDDVQWQMNDQEDPSDLAIYLATYNGQNLTSEQPCIVCSVSDGSTAITLTHPAPHGDSWTWMFYDNDVVIVPGYNYVAESVHFQIQSATPSSSALSLSPAVAAAIGVGGTIVVLAAGLLIGWFCIYRRRKLRQAAGETISAAPSTTAQPYSKQELDSKPGTISSSTDDRNPFSPASVKGASHHEMEVYPKAHANSRSEPYSATVSSPSIASPSPLGGELSTMARHSRLPPRHAGELPVAPVRHEMHHDQRAFASELPGDIELGNPQQTKEWY